ncbi:MAG TPA: hypothetical protein DEH02_09265 [Bacteroidales bacterium]|nr:MAG: hypothetical protein A2X01_00835 [Bacteroidetes bacterium GWF2_35_48]OFY99712.1 MAG: hypothetical protein A2491_16950 [Bacteroidetes bacterium RIFOXYC12_FULL_35_7]HBX51239.1 hypothetical protein [Bacteroidales bacterium]
MKKLSLVILGLMMLAMLGFISCKKECTCISYINGVEVSRTTTEVKGKCSELDSQTTTAGMTSEVKCN